MVTRISDAAASSNLINIMMQAQTRMYDANQQVVSGKVSQDYQGISRLSQRLVNLENSRDLNQRYIDNNTLADLRVTVMSSSVEGIEKAMRDTRLSITTFNGSGQFDQISVHDLQQSAFASLVNIEAFLNTEVNGQFLFSGSETGTKPVNLGLTTLADFQQKFDGSINTYAETRDAHLATISYSKDTPHDDSTNITSTNWLTFRQDDDGVATTSGTSSIAATNALFSNYEVGSQITISDTTNNNGIYTINSISADGTKIFVNTEMLTDEQLPLKLNTQTGVATSTFTLPDNSQLTNADTGNIDFDREAGTITALINDSFDSINVGDIIEIGGSGGSNGTFTVTANDGINKLTVTAGATLTSADGTVIDANDTGRMAFNRSGETITADKAGFSGLSSGDVITIAGTAENNGSYTIDTVAADGKSVTIKGTKLTDEGATNGNNYFDFRVGSQYVFTTVTNTLQAQDIGGTAISGVFSDLQKGDTIVVAGSASNDFTYTVDSISADGSTITFDNTQVAVDETDNDGTDITAAIRGLSFHAGDEIFIDAATDTISLRDITTPATATQNIFSDLRVGMQINLTGTVSNNLPYTIASISADGSSITVSEDIAVTETLDPTADGIVDLAVYATSGTISANNSYYSGDALARQHRVDESRKLDWDLTAIHPAFEKAIRALSIIAQGEFGSEGGLDQNQERVNNALFLINDAMDKTTDGTPPYGAEIQKDLKELSFELDFNKVILHEASELMKNSNTLLDNFIADIENADQLTAITTLVDEQRGLEASYKAMSRLLQLSLSDFL